MRLVDGKILVVLKCRVCSHLKRLDLIDFQIQGFAKKYLESDTVVLKCAECNFKRLHKVWGYSSIHEKTLSRVGISRLLKTKMDNHPATPSLFEDARV